MTQTTSGQRDCKKAKVPKTLKTKVFVTILMYSIFKLNLSLIEIEKHGAEKMKIRRRNTYLLMNTN